MLFSYLRFLIIGEKNNVHFLICIDYDTCNTTATIELDGKPHLVTYGINWFFPKVASVLPEDNNKFVGVASTKGHVRVFRVRTQME